MIEIYNFYKKNKFILLLQFFGVYILSTFISFFLVFFLIILLLGFDLTIKIFPILITAYTIFYFFAGYKFMFGVTKITLDKDILVIMHNNKRYCINIKDLQSITVENLRLGFSSVYKFKHKYSKSLVTTSSKYGTYSLCFKLKNDDVYPIYLYNLNYQSLELIHDNFKNISELDLEKHSKEFKFNHIAALTMATILFVIIVIVFSYSIFKPK